MSEAKAESKPGKRRAEKPKGGGYSLSSWFASRRSSKSSKAGSSSGSGGSGGPGAASQSVNRIRSLIASVVWLVAVLCALALAAGALVVALDFNRNNPVVEFILNLANSLDFGVFKDFAPDIKKGDSAEARQSARQAAQTKSVMVNWGLAALIYLVVGKVLDRLIRPKS